MAYRCTLLLIVCILALVFLETDAIFGLTKSGSLLFYEPFYSYKETSSRKSIQHATEHFIRQRQDNFDAQNHQTFLMRYLSNTFYFKSGGPLFILIGGEWKISDGPISPGQHIYDLAKEFNGMLLYAEHRYYGKSYATNSTSVENLKYLSVDQALADLAHLITEITSSKEINATGGVILFGASYAGSMAAWFRQKYPHLVRGAWASSAPMQAKFDFHEYSEAIEHAVLTIGGVECYYNLKEAFHALTKVIVSKQDELLKRKYRMCDDDDFNIRNNNDVWALKSYLHDRIASVVQHHGLEHIRIGFFCDNLKELYENGTMAIDVLPSLVLPQILTDTEKCTRMSYRNEVAGLRLTNLDSNFNVRLWLYQTCFEFGWHSTTGTTQQLFGLTLPIDYFVNLCGEVFGTALFYNNQIGGGANRVNKLYGGIYPAVTNVIFTYGLVDPWRPMGILNDLNADSMSVLIPDVGHVMDTGSVDSQKDSKEMIFAKLTVTNMIKKWLKQ